MDIKSAEFKGGFPNISLCPSDGRPEFAFIGRSNVGKSSLINLLTNRKELARTSQTPGKTQLLNFFLINEDWYLVDLPGYGYAKVAKTQRQVFSKMIDQYLIERIPLCCAFVLVDANVPPQKLDLEFINHLGGAKVPLALVYTKMDRLSNPRKMMFIEPFQQQLLEYWNALPPQFYTAAHTGSGRSELLDFIAQTRAALPR